MKSSIEAAIKTLAEKSTNGNMKSLERMQVSQAVLNLVNARHSLLIQDKGGDPKSGR
jgi:hypothetical protein